MKKILFLINTLSGGGAEKVLLDTVNNLNKEKYEITVQTVKNEGCYIKQLNSNIRYKSIIKTKNAFLKKVFMKMITKALPSKWVYNWFVKEKYDIEIAYLEGVPTKIISASTNKKSKKVAWLHTDLVSYPNSAKTIGGEKREKECYEKVDYIVCVSNSVKEKLIDKYCVDESKVRVLYNVLDNNAILTKSKENVNLSVQKKPIIMSAGRICYEKGFDILLRIHKRLIDEGQTHSLLIVGDGTMRDELDDYILENNLSETVEITGFQSNPYKYMRQADLFVCSSRVEGYSTVVSEAAIIGLPVLSVDVAGAKEPFDNPRCSMIVDNTEDELYKALEKILSSHEDLQQLKEDVKQRRKNISKERLIEKVENFIDNLIQN